jgi:cysteine-rich repeat protein
MTAPNGTACDDGNACTQSDTCLSGVCTGVTVDNDLDGFSTCAGDCDDTNPNIHPGHVELCDGMDNNCDGIIDEEVCGDGIDNDCDGMIDEEVCGDGIDNDCDGQVDEGCVAVCGNGIVEAGETCDDGNTSGGDGCFSTCTVESGFNCTGSPSVCTGICGDGVVVAGQACDDGNTNNGDGCSSACTVEPGYSCAESPSVCVQE